MVGEGMLLMRVIMHGRVDCSGMEEALKIVMVSLSAQDLGELGRTCRAMAETARRVTERRVGDASQGWETFAVPIENHVDDCLYPDFQYTPFSRLSSPLGYAFGGPWGGSCEVEETRRRGVNESEYGGAIRAGTVLHGAGIGCRCPDNCVKESKDFSDTPEFSSEEGRSSLSGASRDLYSETPERVEEGFKKLSRFEDHNGDRAYSQLELYHQINDRECFEELPNICKSGSSNKRNIFPVKAYSCPCGRFMGGIFAYDSNSRLRIQHTSIQSTTKSEQEQAGNTDFEMLEESISTMQVQRNMRRDGATALAGVHEPPLVMECGQVCSCSNLCKYRVSQNGLGVRVKVVRTRWKGWGLWALQEIKHGSFVCEYAGELITIQRARERQKMYDSEKHGKLWQGSALLTVREHLPSGQASVRVNVDATRVGNVARFINHSCDGGNLMPCLIRTAGCIIPKLAFFTRRDISVGEELTYSYGTANDDGDTSKPCFCGTTACLGWLPFEFT